MGEMVAYVQKAESTGIPGKLGTDLPGVRKLTESLLRSKGSQVLPETLIMDDDGVSVEIVIRFKGKNRAVFVSLDDGKCIALDRSETSGRLITDNYGLLRKLAESVEYQYILNMNYTRFTFSE